MLTRTYALGCVPLFLLTGFFLTAGPAAAQEAPAAPASTTTTTTTAHHGAQAPADEYFGRFKMSILGIRNVITDTDAHIDGAAGDALENLCHKLTLAEDALLDWHAKYPDDSWIPKLGYTMLKDYEKLDALVVDEEFHLASIHAIDLSTWLENAFPNSPFAPK